MAKGVDAASQILSSSGMFKNLYFFYRIKHIYFQYQHFILFVRLEFISQIEMRTGHSNVISVMQRETHHKVAEEFCYQYFLDLKICMIYHFNVDMLKHS